jgi:hypothetical protein
MTTIRKALIVGTALAGLIATPAIAETVEEMNLRVCMAMGLLASNGAKSEAEIRTECKKAVADLLASPAASKQAPVPVGEIQSQVMARLRDPESARFGEMWLGPSKSLKPGVRIVCGTVNSKNGFGGYTGPELYSASINDQGAVTYVWMPGSFGQYEHTHFESCGIAK